jgi:hypothetical protein
MTIQDLTTLIEASSLDANEKSSYIARIQDLTTPLSTNDLGSHSRLIKSIPQTSQPTCLPLACLSLILATHPGPWPVFDLIQCLSTLWKAMPEAGKAGHDQQMSQIAETTIRQVKTSYRGLTDLFFEESNEPAFIDPAKGTSLPHRTLTTFIKDFKLPIAPTEGPKPIVVVALPNGPLLALACMAVSTWYSAAPINATAGAGQFESDVMQTGSKTILASRADVKKLALDGKWISKNNINVILLETNAQQTFDMTPLNPAQSMSPTTVAPNGPDDIAFILFTSGTSGTKKVVPLTMHMIISGVSFVIESWGLTERDSCLNMMPLNHV